MKIELGANCSEIEDMLSRRYNLSEPVKLMGLEFDEGSDLVAFSFEVDAEDSIQIDRNWDSSAFTTGLIEEAI